MAKVKKPKQRADEQWEDIRARVNQTIRRFIRDTKWEIDWEEAWAEAGLIFAECTKTLDRVRASLSTFVCYKVYKRLLSLRRKAARRNAIVKISLETDVYNYQSDGDEPQENLDSLADPNSEVHNGFDLLDFLDVLPGDAAAVVWLAVCPPTRLKRQSRAALKSYLSKAGWDDKRISRAFKHVRRKLR